MRISCVCLMHLCFEWIKLTASAPPAAGLRPIWPREVLRHERTIDVDRDDYN